MPAIFAVGAAQSPLSFKRDAGSERVSPFSINAWHVVRVKDAVGVRVDVHRVFESEAGIVSPGLIDENARTVRPISRDQRRDHVDRELKLAFSVGQAGFAFPQRRVALRTFD